MQIAIVAPSSKPFVWGGAENLYAGLQSFINAETRHGCELIKVTAQEQDLLSLITSYRTFLDLDVSHFDVVISTKYPSWMVQNDQHICYMLHKLRGLYDTYHFMGQPTDLKDVSPAIARRLSAFKGSLTKGCATADSVRALTEYLLDRIARDTSNAQFRFPGPLSRQIAHLLDDYALQSQRVRRHAAISRNVATRQGYFPVGAPVSVLHPPPRTQGFRCGSDDYFFTMSRLDSPKRIDLLIKSALAMRDPVPLVIAGSGPEEARLKEIANGSPAVTFLGNISDEEAIEYYSNALAVPFVPYDEDYGYITIEAMLSNKPVITLTDAGGPLEFVRHGETGLICDPEVEALTATLEHAAGHRAELRAMGRAGARQVSGISWKSVVDGLLGDDAGMTRTFSAPTGRRANRPKIVGLVTFPIHPARGGGQTRIFNLYSALAREIDVEVICMSGPNEDAGSCEVAPGLIQTKVPVTEEQVAAETALSASMNWVPVTDIAAIDGWKFTPALATELRRAAEGARAVVLSHPYLYRCFKSLGLDLPMWFEAHNVEAPLKAQILPQTEDAQTLVNLVSEVEKDCWQEAELVFACAQDDLDTLAAIFGPRNGPAIEVPNGVDASRSPFVPPRHRHILRAELGIDFGASALFIGSWHDPNIMAAREIIRIAQDLPTVQFFVAGSVCLAVEGDDKPPNLILLGVLDDEVKALVSNLCDIALNPMETGSGSNLKMFDYFSAGIPVISTPFGARGIQFMDAECYLASEMGEFGINIVKLLTDLGAREELSIKARQLVETKYDWNIIAEEFFADLKHLDFLAPTRVRTETTHR